MKLLKLPTKKEMSLGTLALKRPQAPERLRVPIYRNAPFYQKPCVAPGELVSCGMKIAEPGSSSGIPLFSPVNGSVIEIVSTLTAAGESVLAVEILVDKKNPFSHFSTNENPDWQGATIERLRAQIREAGVMLCGRDTKPLVSVLEKGPFHEKSLIINACESEPYVTSGQVLLMKYPLEILKGAEILRRAAGLKEIIIALSEDLEQAAEVLKSKIYFLKWEHVRIEVFPALYPQDEPAVLLPALDSHFEKTNSNLLHDWPLPDIATVYAAYEAVALAKPFFERVVTIAGECVVLPQNLMVPFGISAADVLKSCKGLLREPGRMIAGGPMRGKTLTLMSAPLSVATEALIALPKENTADAPAVDCIRCGECIDFCPVDISPVLIAMAAEKQDFAQAREFGAIRCIACGNCSWVCPSHIPLKEKIQSCNG